MGDHLQKLRCLSGVLLLTLLVTNPVWADDTEIFFGRSSNTDIQPNVLFMLDGSGSMAWYDCEDAVSDSVVANNHTYEDNKVRNIPCPDDTPNGNTTRLVRLKDSLKSVLNNTSNVNVGLMRFSHTNSGGRVTYPIKDIDQQMCGGEPCGDDTVFTAQSKTRDSNDDAVQKYNGDVITDQFSIALTTTDDDDNEDNQWIGLRFPDLRIPQGATITDARLDFSSITDSDSDTSLVIHSVDSNDVSAFTTSPHNVSQKSRFSNSVSWNAIPEWDDEGSYESPNIAPLIQQVVSKTGWCGGNALGLILNGSGERLVAASDSGASTSPSLRVSYKLDNVSASGGCTKTVVITRVSDPKDDGHEQKKKKTGQARSTKLNSNTLLASKFTNSKHGYETAVRFKNVNVPKDANILEASLTMVTRSNTFSSAPSIKLSAHDSASPAKLEARWRNISNRPKTASVTWSGLPTNSNADATSPSIKNMVQNLVNKGGWSSGNPMVFMLEQNGNGGHRFYSYDSNPSKAPLLRIVFETPIQSAQDKINGPVTDVRTEIIAELDSMTANHGTPTVGALLEAKRYFAGQNVKYGLNRYDSTYHNNLYNRDMKAYPYYWGRYSRVSTRESYTGGNVVRSDSCNINALDGKYCATEYITGTPVYISPFSHECQTNHVVLLTDGEPSSDPDAVTSVEGMIPGTCDVQPDGNGTCGEEIAEHMKTTDQHSFAGDQFITTHTIGFNFTTQWLQDVAAAGGGGYYTADSADQLSAALANIIDSVQDESASFVAPGATVDNFSKVSHRSDIYLALFQPQSTPGWDGNLKRYDFSGNPAALRDVNSELAIDTETGKFFDSSKSHWSAAADGNTVSKGGAAGRILPNDRNVYTNTGESKYLTHESNEFSLDNDVISTTVLGLETNDSINRAKLINWALGYDIKDEDGDNITDEPRYHIGDPLHSRPVIITYGGTSEDPESVIFFGTNDGFMHAVNTDNGDEVFSFIPTDLIPNLKPLYEGNPATDKIYGLDGSMSLWTEDKNYNGIIEEDDHVYLYAGMRRGGYSYYALDVTDKDSPEFKWKISDETTGFEELGQTWSQALPTRINYLGSERDVLIFGGGYDTAQDENTIRTPDTIGRSIYIVDADDGELLWSGGPQNGTEIKSFTNMTYSFPATPKAVDANGDGLAEQLYIGDMGGRIWRFDIDPTATEKSHLVEGGIIADLGQDGFIADTRRFYHTPDISVSNIDGVKYMNIAVGSGYQAHPLDTAIEDNFYLIRYPYDTPVDEDGIKQYGVPDISRNRSGVLTDVDTLHTPILGGDLFDATSNIIGEGSPDDKQEAELALADSNGWFIHMEGTGEKVLGTSVTFDNKILFTSYIPGGTPSGCAPEIGHGVFWAVNLWDATPVVVLGDDESTALVKADRHRIIPGGGIPAPVQTLFIESGNTNDDGDIVDNKLQILAISGANKLLTLDSKDLVQRVYWSEYPNF